MVQRKLILVLALVAAMGLGSGMVAEELCACGGWFVDDPSTPVRMTELALPSHTQAAQKAVAPSVGTGMLPQQVTQPAFAREAPQVSTPATPSRPVPIRC